MQNEFSFIIPVFNRPNEIEELLVSFTKLTTKAKYEIVIIEDGSTISSKTIVDKFNRQLNISYYFKENSGPGDSRNYGMQKAKGNYFIILDSDCILPAHYLDAVEKELNNEYVDCFGGPDTADNSFTNLQKAINFSMTAFITTGGIRGKKSSVNKFQPRSFNMGLSKKAFLATKGFGNIHPGEDPDLSIRLWQLGFKTKLFTNAYVYHKRRISWSKFYKQVNKFGKVRPILNTWHPKTKKLTYWFPTIFTIGLILSIILCVFNIFWALIFYLIYYLTAFISAIISTKSIIVASQSIIAITIQFFGYGVGFLKSTLYLTKSNKKPEVLFPELFFKSK
ncbi:glycosyltransferase family 2 protein [Lacinutrix sp. 5H-3-7-4]|uniref:glycosyltransferase n=1 Tax=Lacinutrix sp. (strain 5H-3-7-4) TaxID=983544 RepID=UPI00020A3CAC|nr:glycosyltransferase [Lacinutrix sp. 5H-3-7-4]AEH02796.1 glycosyl transferase family 2 [Lacinutrix sp. 5H-3-7-4]